MEINVRVQGPSTAYPIEPFSIREDQCSLLPNVGDQITNGGTTVEVKSRVFRFGSNEVNITLVCDY